jgi:apolipoprotein N-acyltransferase
LRTLAADADTRPMLALRAAEAIRARPWSGVALALLAGVALGAGPRSWRGALAPFAVPLLGPLAAALLRSPGDSWRPSVAPRTPRQRRPG